jgi:arginase
MKVRVILVPYDSGHCRKRMGLGPEHMWESGLRELLLQMELPFDVEEVSLESAHPAEISAAFQLARQVATRVHEAQAADVFPIVLSGNCNAAIGTVSGCGAGKIGIVWFDAHGEATTPETTRSGFLDGMPISILLGRAWQTLARMVPGFAPVPGERIVLFGARQVEEAETTLLDEAGVQRVATVEQLMKSLPGLTKAVDQIYLHVDLDVLDPSEAIANQWTPPNGITLRILLDAVAEVRKQVKVAGLGIASYDPALDRDGRALSAALGVVEVLLGK